MGLEEDIGDSQKPLAMDNSIAKLNNDNSQLHTSSYGLTISFLLPTFMNTTFLLYCKCAILNLSNSYTLPSSKYFSSAS